MPNLNLISVPKYSNGEVEDALMREIVNGFQLEQQLEQERYSDAREAAHAFRQTTGPFQDWARSLRASPPGSSSDSGTSTGRKNCTRGSSCGTFVALNRTSASTRSEPT